MKNNFIPDGGYYTDENPLLDKIVAALKVKLGEEVNKFDVFFQGGCLHFKFKNQPLSSSCVLKKSAFAKTVDFDNTIEDIYYRMEHELIKGIRYTKTKLMDAFESGKTLQVLRGKEWLDFVPQNPLDRPNLDHGLLTTNWRIKPDEKVEPPVYRNFEIRPNKEFEIGWDRVRTVQDVVAILKGLQMRVFIPDGEVPEHLKEAFSRGLIKEKE